MSEEKLVLNHIVRRVAEYMAMNDAQALRKATRCCNLNVRQDTGMVEMINKARALIAYNGAGNCDYGEDIIQLADKYLKLATKKTGDKLIHFVLNSPEIKEQ